MSPPHPKTENRLSNPNVPMNHLETLVIIYILSHGAWMRLRLCVSNELPCSPDAAGPRPQETGERWARAHTESP